MDFLTKPNVGFILTGSSAQFSLPLVKQHLEKNEIFGRLELFPIGGLRVDGVVTSVGVDSSWNYSIGQEISGEFSQKLLAEWQEFSAHEDFASVRFVALKLLNRNDLSGSLRMLEREVLFASAVMRILQVLADTNYSLLVFDVTPHQFLQYVTWKVAEWRGLAVLFFQPVGIAPLMIPRTSLEEALKFGFRSHLRADVLARCEAIFDDELRGLTVGQDPPYMEKQKARDLTVGRNRQKWLSLRNLALWLFRDRYNSSIDFLGHGGGNAILRRLAAVAAGRSLQLSLRQTIAKQSVSTIASKKYALFALHYEPERTSLPEGLPIDFQADAVGVARSLLPGGVELYVKEHYSQQTSALRGFAGRSPRFYNLIDAFADTYFLPIEQNLSEAINGASFVFTIAGSVAIEAAVRGVPVLYFGSPWWEGLPGSYKISRKTKPGELAGFIPSTAQEVRGFLQSLLQECTLPGVAGESRTNAARRYGDLSSSFYQTEAASIALCIEEVIRSSANGRARRR